MENELDLDLDQIEEDATKGAEIKNRYKQLSEKVIQEKKEKEELATQKAAAEADKVKVERERDFYKDFSTHSTKYPAAPEFQTQIWEKVQGGYSTEDAIISTLAKEGKLGLPEAPVNAPNSPIGGSASNQIGDLPDKKLQDLTIEEKLAQLTEAEKRGELSV